ncbi:MAG: S-methyl-5-thioribose-1-phosphate isomerase [Chloroflexota bacterium]
MSAEFPRTLEYRDRSLFLLDQTKLPHQEEIIRCTSVEQVGEAIKSLRVRGAPAIGLAAAYGVVLAAEANLEAPPATFREAVDLAMSELARTRPTAVNLFGALRRMADVLDRSAPSSPGEMARALRDEADRMLREDESANRRMGEHGAALIADGARILTHCNTGALATGAFGTALGVIRTAHEQGKAVSVWVDETRPLLQGSRLTTWELQRMGVPFTLITDSMAGHFMARDQVDLVIVGADRIASNGDTANKIGTYSLAILADAHGLPFYVAAPTTTIDLDIDSGSDIPIEQRASDEVASFAGRRVAPNDVAVAGPAFDVTPSRLIAGIVTENGVAIPPYGETLARMVSEGP